MAWTDQVEVHHAGCDSPFAVKGIELWQYQRLEHMLGRRGFVSDSVVWRIVPDQPSKRRECDLVLIAADDWPNSGMPMVDWCKGWGVPILVVLGKQSLHPEAEVRHSPGMLLWESMRKRMQ